MGASVPRRALRFITTAFLLAFLVWTCAYIVHHWRDFAVLTEVPAYLTGGLFLAFGGIIVTSALFTKVALELHGKHLGNDESLALTVLSSLANYFVPLKTGAGLRVLYLMKYRHITLPELAAVFLIYGFMQAFLNGLLGATGMMLAAKQAGAWNSVVFGFFVAAMLIGLGGLSSTAEYFVRKLGVARRRLSAWTECWAAVRQHPRQHVLLWAVSAAFCAATFMQSVVAFAAVKIAVPSGGVLVFTASKNLAALAGLTPGAIGIQEAIAIYLGRDLDYTTTQALLVQLLVRGTAIAGLAAAAPFAGWLIRASIRRHSEAAQRAGGSHAGA